LKAPPKTFYFQAYGQNQSARHFWKSNCGFVVEPLTAVEGRCLWASSGLQLIVSA
jgi:hypothetical protein